MAATQYTALWCDNGSTPLAGLLAVERASLRFEGRSADRQARRRVGFDEIRSFRLARSPLERILGRPAIVLDIGRPAPIRVASTEPGALHEVLDKLTLEAKP
jgi:hypothetical protein